MNPNQFLLFLHSVPNLGEKALTRLLHLLSQRRLSPQECLSLTAEEWRNYYELDSRAATYIVENRNALMGKSAELARLLPRHSLTLLSLESASYPARLEQFDDAPPPLLYTLGNHTLLKASPSEQCRFTFTIAVSNGATPAVLNRQDEIATALSSAGGVPVTGHDRRPYQRLALAAQRQNRPILYVLDRGLREALGPDFDRPPFAAARIREAVFVPERDLVISPFRLDDHGIGANNRRRDRIVFAAADIVIALDVRGGGGMAGECLRAKDQGKRVYVAKEGRDGNSALLTAGCLPLPTDLTELLPIAKD